MNKLFQSLCLVTLCALGLAPHASGQFVAGYAGPSPNQRTFLVVSNLTVNTNVLGAGLGMFTNNQTVTNLSWGGLTTYGTNNFPSTANFPNYFGANYGAYLWLTNQNVFAVAPTLIGGPYGVHEIGVDIYVVNTNNGGETNLQVKVYPAYDTMGIGGGLYGLLFDTNNLLLSETLAFGTNIHIGTNIAIPTWSPATSLGYTFSNNGVSNITFTVIQNDLP